jgi:hypothetical protein
MSVYRDMTGINCYEDGEERPYWQRGFMLLVESFFLAFFDFCEQMATHSGFLTHERCEAIISACRRFVDWLTEKCNFDKIGEKIGNAEVSAWSRRFLRELYKIVTQNLRKLDRRVLTPMDKWLKNAVSKAGTWKDEVIDLYRTPTFSAPVVPLRVNRQFNLAGPEKIRIRGRAVGE